MKLSRLLAAAIALVMALAAFSPAASAAKLSAELRDGAEEFPITPYAGDGVTLDYDGSAFSLLLSRNYGVYRVEEARTLTLTASFDEGWTYNADHSNFFNTRSDRVAVTDGENGALVFTLSAAVGDMLMLDDLLTVGVYASAAELPKLEIATEIPFSQIGKDEYVAATFTLTLGTKQYESGDFEGTGSIKGRGNTSWGQPQKPYSIKLDSKKSLLDIPKTKKYAIVPSYSDQSSLRNFMTYKSGLVLDGIGYVPKCEFCEVYLNGVYNGVYILVERVAIESNKVDIEEATADELTGGYLIEKDISGKIDFSSDLWFECPYWANPDRDYFVLKDPEPEDTALWQQMKEYLTGYMQSVHQAVTDTASDAYTQYVDTASWIDFIIVQELAKNIDGNLKTSCYMYKQAQDDKLYMTAPWDFDLAYGNPETTWNNASYQHNDYYDCPDAISPADFMVINSSCPWFDTLYDDHEEFNAALKAKYTEYRRTLIPEMLRLLDSGAAYLASSMPRNDAKWGKHFEQGVSDLRSWLLSRIAWLDGQWRTDAEAIDLDYALNTDGGTLSFNTSQHAFTGVIKDGRIAGMSGNAGQDNSSSSITITLAMRAGDTLSFDYKVSSESNYDWFSFSVNGTRQFRQSGEHDWTNCVYTAAEDGSYSFEWKYEKDYSYASGSDCAWVDEVILTTESGPEPGLPGDADGDGSVTVTDALLVLRRAMNIIPELPCPENCDMDGDGSFTVTDALMILRLAMNITAYPPKKKNGPSWA